MEKTKIKKEKKKISKKESEKLLPSGAGVEADYKLTVVNKKLHVVDNRTGKTIDIKTVADLQLLGISLGEVDHSENKEWEPTASSIQNFSPNQLTSLKNILSEMGPTAQKSLIEEAIEKIVAQSSNKDTFALPSHPLMFTLLAMFAGKPDMIPRGLLTKPHSEWTEKEHKEAEEFFSSIIKVEKTTTYESGKEETHSKHIAVISDNPKVEASAQIDIHLFKSDIHFREMSLALYIKRTFGAEGLRHLLGLLIGLEENFRKGHFIWSVNDHLARLGHKKKANGSYDHELKKTASEIIRIFQSLFITARRKDGKSETLRGERLFSIDGFQQEIFDKVIIDEKIKLRATDFWYKNAFEPKDGQSAKYTKLLKKIAQENHRVHPLTIYLTPLLAIFWRMSPQQKISVTNLMDWCHLGAEKRYKMRDLRSLESELNYMKQNGYLGEWSHTGEKELPSECENPFTCSLTLTPPDWFGQEIGLIQSNKEIPALEGKNEEDKLVNFEEFREIYKKSNLNVRQFGNSVGITGQMVSYLLNEKRQISKEVSDKVRAFADKNL
jgi:hypothetical protein